ncbi:hypothetical protein [Streptomyces sp. NPDC001250]|uniref:hypothetical protein n=1 Tax=unclassified Streptomyces TaxID=2593676 RepID=UPI0033269381
MTRFLTSEWFEVRMTLVDDLPELPGASARLQHRVTEADGRVVPYYDVIENGRLTASGLGMHPEPDVEIAMTVDATNWP